MHLATEMLSLQVCIELAEEDIEKVLKCGTSCCGLMRNFSTGARTSYLKESMCFRPLCSGIGSSE